MKKKFDKEINRFKQLLIENVNDADPLGEMGS